MESGTLTLLRRWHSGDADALASLVERHLPAIRERVRRRAGPLLRSREETDDLVQDAMIRFLTDGPRFQVMDDEHFRMLLARIIENVLRDKYEWHTRRRRDAARVRALPSSSIVTFAAHAAPQDTPSQLFDAQEREAWIQFGMELLEPEERELIVARDWDQAAFGDIAARTGVSEDAARMRYNRSIAKLTRLLGLLRRGQVERALGSLDTESLQ